MNVPENKIVSVGIDVGTSTTQVVFSELTLRNVGGFGTIPRIEITDKSVIYESDIYFTPLLPDNEIDMQKVRDLVYLEYEKSGFRPEDIGTGAVIITGESLKKKNAKRTAEVIEGLAGDFVVSSAGPDMEGVLAGYGAQSHLVSEKTGKLVANLDIGGGTTNICYFENGRDIDTGCLDLGGRLIKVEGGRIVYIADKLKMLIEKMHLPISLYEPAEEKSLRVLTTKMTELMAEAVGLKPKTSLLDFFYTNHGMTDQRVPEIFVFSGGVGECMRAHFDSFTYGDIGVMLAEAIKTSPWFRTVRTEPAAQTVRATVIGVGSHSMDISGSTIAYRNCELPMKNLPVLFVPFDDNNSISELSFLICREYERFHVELENKEFVLTFKGPSCPSFQDIEAIAEQIVLAFPDQNLLLMIENDIGKAVGQALFRKTDKDRTVLCLDGISCSGGTFVDIGKPLVGGNVLPVIIKTLLFS